MPVGNMTDVILPASITVSYGKCLFVKILDEGRFPETISRMILFLLRLIAGKKNFKRSIMSINPIAAEVDLARKIHTVCCIDRKFTTDCH